MWRNQSSNSLPDYSDIGAANRRVYRCILARNSPATFHTISLSITGASHVHPSAPTYISSIHDSARSRTYSKTSHTSLNIGMLLLAYRRCKGYNRTPTQQNTPL